MVQKLRPGVTGISAYGGEGNESVITLIDNSELIPVGNESDDVTIEGVSDDNELAANDVPDLIEEGHELGEPQVDQTDEMSTVTYTSAIESTFGERQYTERDLHLAERCGKSAHTVQTVTHTIEKLPQNIAGALQKRDADSWKRAIEKHVQSFFQNKTWTATTPRPAKKILDSRFIFQKKYKSDCSVERHKARLVAKGFQEGG